MLKEQGICLKCRVRLVSSLKVLLQDFVFGVVPKYLKRVNLLAIYKKGPGHLPCNYRLDSATSYMRKTPEAHIGDSLLEYLLKNKLIKGTWHGFIWKRFC
jgi:hypothetical protein